MSGPVVALTRALPNTRDEIEHATRLIMRVCPDHDDILAALGLDAS